MSTTLNLRELLRAAPLKKYAAVKTATSSPRSRFFDSRTRRFTGENIGLRGTRSDLSVVQIIEAEGERSPPFGQAPTAFRHAFVLIVPKGRTASGADIAKLAGIRRAWETFYRDATDARSTVTTSLQFGFSTISDSLLGGAARSCESRGVEVRAVLGYARLDPGTEPSSGVAILTSRSSGRVVSETAVRASATMERARFAVIRRRGFDTGMAVAAPLAAATVDLALRDGRGALRAIRRIHIPAGGQQARFATELFGEFEFPDMFDGSMTLRSSAPVVVTVLEAMANSAGDFLTAVLPVADLDAPESPGETESVYLPHIAAGGGFESEILLVNPRRSPLEGTLRFVAPDGSPLEATIDGTLAAGARYRLGPNGTQTFRTAEATGTPSNGYGVVEPDGGQAVPLAGALITRAAAGE